VAFVEPAEAEVAEPEVVTVIPTSTLVSVVVTLERLLAFTPSWLATALTSTVGAARLVAFGLGVVVTMKLTTSSERPRRERAAASIVHVPAAWPAQSVASSATFIWA
jgi:hypothetical protein